MYITVKIRTFSGKDRYSKLLHCLLKIKLQPKKKKVFPGKICK